MLVNFQDLSVFSFTFVLNPCNCFSEQKKRKSIGFGETFFIGRNKKLLLR
jgi:hypothetical protein